MTKWLLRLLEEWKSGPPGGVENEAGEGAEAVDRAETVTKCEPYVGSSGDIHMRFFTEHKHSRSA